MHRRSAGLGLALALVVGVAWQAIPAVAHAVLIGSSPEDGAVLTDAPDNVVLEFDEPVQQDFSQVAVIDAAENHYEDGDPQIVGGTITQAVTELPAGDYQISYRAGSSDGHPVTGVIAFTVAAPEGDVPSEPETDGDGPGGADATGSADAETNSDPTSATPDADDADQPEENGAPMATIAATVAAVALVGVAGVLLIRRRPDSKAGGS